MSNGLDEMKPTKLGTKEHWDSIYEDELSNFTELGDEGEIWFGEESVEKIVQWALSNVPPKPSLSILEIGCGNGTLVSAMAQAGYAPEHLLGIDYSGDAVKLARSVAEARGFGGIAFEQCDFLRENPPQIRVPQVESTEAQDDWDLLLDKGTFDAIALGEKGHEGQNPAGAYPRRVARLLKAGGVFLITSCNFTEDELKLIFLKEPSLEFHSRIQHATYTFGGKTGSICSSVGFRKQ